MSHGKSLSLRLTRNTGTFSPNSIAAKAHVLSLDSEKYARFKSISPLVSSKTQQETNGMSLIPELSNPYLGAFAGGLLYGVAVCTASCLPYIASYVAGIGAGFRKGVGVTMVFSSGRIAGYALIGGAVGLFSGVFRLLTSSSAFAPFQIYSGIGFGAVTIVIGVSVFWKSRKPCECNTANKQKLVILGNRSWRGFDLGAFSLGLTRGLIICPPLIALLLYSLPFSTPIGSVGFSRLIRVGNFFVADAAAWWNDGMVA